jgi:hypothetical protein
VKWEKIREYLEKAKTLAEPPAAPTAESEFDRKQREERYRAVLAALLADATPTERVKRYIKQALDAPPVGRYAYIAMAIGEAMNADMMDDYGLPKS